MVASTETLHDREDALTARFDEARRLGYQIRVEGLGHRLRQEATERPVHPLRLTEWNALIAYQPADLVVTVEAGMTIAQLNAYLAPSGQWVPLTVADGQDDTVGGAVAAGLDGVWRGGYGPFRDRVLGMRVLTPGMGAIQVGAQVVKNVAGYNLPRLFMGSRGHLGVITQVTLKVSPIPPVRWSWVWEGTIDQLIRQADILLGLANPWASILLVQEPGLAGWRLWAQWHGIEATVDYLRQALGEGAPELPWWRPPGLAPREVTLKGAVPRRIIGDLIRAWEDGPLAVEWQTGSFWGALTAGGADRIRRWIRERSGGVEVLSGPSDAPEMPDILRGPWQRLKVSYDPDAILV
ncbi:MAG: FAD-binding oxidoreductase [Sulfobacillus sp.]|nr:FAD-binding oxidoreductase [Sulfobacillus sp.]